MASNLLGQGLVLAVAFIAVRFIYRQLGEDVFGIIYFNITLATVLSTLLEVGVLSTATREVSRYHALDPTYVTAFIRTASLGYWCFGVAIAGAIFLTAPLLVERWVHLGSLDPSTATALIRVLGLGTTIVLPRALYISLLRGRQRMDLNNAIDVMTTVVQQLGIVLILSRGGGFFLVATWIPISMFLSVAAYCVVAGRMFGRLALVPGFDFNVVRRNARYTTWMMSNSLLSLVHSQADKVVVSKFVSVADFGLYSFASTTLSRANFAAIAIGQAGFASFSALLATEERPTLVRQFWKLQELVCFVSLPIYAAVCYGALPVLTYVFSGQVASRLLWPTIIMAFAYYVSGAVTMPFMVASAMGRPAPMVKGNLLALFLVLPLTVVLIRQVGIVGAAASWFVYNLFVLISILPVICRECLDMGPWQLYVRIARPFLLALFVYGCIWVVIGWLNAHWWLGLLLGYGLATIGFSVCSLWLMGADLRTALLGLPQALRLRKQPTA